MNFSWAMDLDPKGANNQIKEAIDKRYLPDDEEPVTPDDYIYYSSKRELTGATHTSEAHYCDKTNHPAFY